MNWLNMNTAQRTEALQKLIDGNKRLSSSQLAGHFSNASRSAVIGHCYRYKIPLPVGASKADPNKPRSKFRKPPPPPGSVDVGPKASKPLPKLVAVPSSALRVTWNTAIDGRTHCKWPLWGAFDTGDTSEACGAGRVEGKPYCPYHSRIAFVSAEERKRAR